LNHQLPTTAESAQAVDSIEWQILLATASPNLPGSEPGEFCEWLAERVKELAVDWKVLLRLAERHGTTCLLYRSLARSSEFVPAAIFDSLRQSHESNVRKSLLLARELMRILECARKLDIELIPYKGIVLAETYYGDIALRPTGDIDLFVRPKDAARMKNAVRDLGYTLRQPIPEAAEASYIHSAYEYSFDSAAGKNVLELQWALQPRFYAVDYEVEGLFARAAVAKVAGQSVKTLSAEDLLLVLSIHAAKHVWERLIWISDIAQILQHGNLNWEFIRSQARDLGVVRILHLTLLLANRFLQTQIPAAIAGQIQADRAAPKFLEEMSRSVINEVSYEEQKTSYFRLMMRLRERRSDQLRFIARLAFTPGPGEWEMARLPRTLSPLYRVVRLARLGQRLARSNRVHTSD